MQEEISKHGKKILKEVSHPTHTFRQKATEVVTEVLIIVFAITLSIWFHSMSEHKHEQAEVQSFLKGLHEDLQSDIKHYSHDSISFDQMRELFKGRRGQTKASIDSSMKVNSKFNYNYTLPNLWCNLQEGRYQGFKSSGKIELVENDSLKTAILTYYEQTIPEIHRMEEDFKQVRIEVTNKIVSDAENTKPVYAITKMPMKLLYYQAETVLEKIIRNNNWALSSARAMNVEIEKELK
ncbi:MAG: hypothetical protein H7339_04755 [Arcicella sp.]|nr:hypothetical protein [Arcicella sp.]